MASFDGSGIWGFRGLGFGGLRGLEGFGVKRFRGLRAYGFILGLRLSHTTAKVRALGLQG